MQVLSVCACKEDEVSRPIYPRFCYQNSQIRQVQKHPWSKSKGLCMQPSRGCHLLQFGNTCSFPLTTTGRNKAIEGYVPLSKEPVNQIQTNRTTLPGAFNNQLMPTSRWKSNSPVGSAQHQQKDNINSDEGFSVKIEHLLPPVSSSTPGLPCSKTGARGLSPRSKPIFLPVSVSVFLQLNGQRFAKNKHRLRK